MWLGTFHSLSAKILRQHAEIVNLKSNIGIIDSDDQLKLIKQNQIDTPRSNSILKPIKFFFLFFKMAFEYW